MSSSITTLPLKEMRRRQTSSHRPVATRRISHISRLKHHDCFGRTFLLVVLMVILLDSCIAFAFQPVLSRFTRGSSVLEPLSPQRVSIAKFQNEHAHDEPMEYSLGLSPYKAISPSTSNNLHNTQSIFFKSEQTAFNSSKNGTLDIIHEPPSHTNTTMEKHDGRNMTEPETRTKRSEKSALQGVRETKTQSNATLASTNSSTHAAANVTLDQLHRHSNTTNTSVIFKAPSFSWPHMDPTQYFQFQSKQSGNKTYHKSTGSGTNKSSHKKPTSSSSTDLISLLESRSPHDLVTVQDLRTILSTKSSPSKQETPISSKQSLTARPGMIEASLPETTSSKSGLTAFPQPSKLSSSSLKRGTAVAGGVIGMLLGTSIIPNLWLIGLLMGSFYGYDLVQRAEDRDRNIVATLIVKSGTVLTQRYLQVYDAVVTLFFMYKTGQLSYEYYQRYAQLDERFAIQNKIDAWNTRFAEGKIAFDRWEKENEVGRKVLAGLRTIWLVEERSLKKTRLLQRRTSRYRLIQTVYDAAYWLGRSIGVVFQTLLGRGDGSIQEFLVGLTKWDLSQHSMGSRIGAAMALVVCINFAGAMFSTSPLSLSLLAVGIGWIWPSWISQSVEHLNDVWDEARARGRGEDPATETLSTSKKTQHPLFSWQWASSSNLVSRRRRKEMDKSRYHYYYTKDGKKRYYRVGIPFFPSQTKATNSKPSFWPWQNNEPKRNSQQGWWI